MININGFISTSTIPISSISYPNWQNDRPVYTDITLQLTTMFPPLGQVTNTRGRISILQALITKLDGMVNLGSLILSNS